MGLHSVRKKRRSLVRIFASCIPSFLWEFFLPVTPRMYISSHLLQNISTARLNNYPSDDSSTSFCSFKQNFHNRNQQEILNSTPKKANVEDDKLRVLQEQLDQIKKMIAKLMERQNEQCSGYETYSNPSDQLQKSLIISPPPPPPPPPPLPSFSLLPLNSPVQIAKKKSVILQPVFPCGKELLRDLKKVQLKKIEKSPGGGPLKKPQKVINDPGDILAAVLKKRFGCVQNSPDSSLESSSVDAENSFGSGNINNSYEIGKNNKIKAV